MPNWCKNRVELSGDANDLSQIKAMIGTDRQRFSFQAILPMPAELDIEQGACSLGYDAKYGDWRRLLSLEWVSDEISTQDALIVFMAHECPEQIRLADQLKSNMDRYGHTPWLNWCYANWGVKWDIGPEDIEVVTDEAGCLRLAFDTAWCPPIGIYDALVELIDENGLDIALTWFYDEPDNAIAGYLPN